MKTQLSLLGLQSWKQWQEDYEPPLSSATSHRKKSGGFFLCLTLSSGERETHYNHLSPRKNLCLTD